MSFRHALVVPLLLAASVLQAASVVPTPPAVEARAHLLLDYHSGRVLAESNADERLEPASLTKMMTVYAVYAELGEGKVSLDDQVLISEKAWRMKGSRMFVEVGDRVSLLDLVKGVVVQSGNDASVAVAEHVAGDESAFADLMNRYASRLGMDGSHFTNSSGLPGEEHYTTARDMAIIAAALVRDFPDAYEMHAIKEYEFGGITQRNRNKLLWRDESVDGLKTGYTKAAGYGLVASAERDGMRLISVVMGSESEKERSRYSQALLRYGFRFYETHRLYKGGEPIKRTRVWRGAVDQMAMGIARDLYVTVPRGQYKSLEPRAETAAQILAPVRSGEPQGTLSVVLAGEELARRPLIALGDVPEGNLWRQLSDRVLMMFE